MIQIESNTAGAKSACYGAMVLSTVACFVILVNINPTEKQLGAWGMILVIILLGIALPRWYVTTLKLYRVTVTQKEFLLEMLPDTVLKQEPMNTLIVWRVAQYSARSGKRRCLYFDFRQSSLIMISDLEYAHFEQLVAYMATNYPRKNFTNKMQ